MDPNLVATWLMEKNNNDQQKVLQEAVTLLAEFVALVPEFRQWATLKKAQIAALITPEALEAAKAERETALQAELVLVDAASQPPKPNDLAVP